MVRATWVKPMTLVQKFEANEAVAANQCWYLICERGGTAGHTACDNRGNYHYYDDNDNGIIDRVQLQVAANKYDLTFYTTDSYENSVNLEELDPKAGQTLYWTNKIWPVTYYHRGVLQATNADNPNFS